MTDEALTRARKVVDELNSTVGWLKRTDHLYDANRVQRAIATIRDLIQRIEQAEAARDAETLRAEAALTIVDEHNEARIAAEAERDDLGSRLSELLWELTDGRMSKTGYDVRTMVGEVEAAFERAAQAEIQVYADMATRALAERDEWQAKAEARTQITDEMVERATYSVMDWGLSDVPPNLCESIARAALEAALTPKEAT